MTSKGKGGARIDFRRVAEAAVASLESLLLEWLPGGHREGHEFKALNPTRADGKIGSFSVNLNTGAWGDFATGDKGGDPVSLYAYIQGMSQLDAAKALAEQLAVPMDASAAPPPAAAPSAKRRTDWVPLMPVPADAPEPPKAHVVRGLPEAVWRYRTPGKHGDEQLLGLVYRFRTSDGGKEILPCCYAEHLVKKTRQWRWLAFPEPRPLYIPLDHWPYEDDDKVRSVIVVEGEKCADIACDVFQAEDVCTWPGGSNAVDRADWTLLAGRKVIIWPDCDAQRDKTTHEILPEERQPGTKSAERIAAILCALDPPAKVKIVAIPKPGDKPAGWDVADAVAEGWTREQLYAFIQDNQRDPRGEPVKDVRTQRVARADIVATPTFGDEPLTSWKDPRLRKNDEGGLRTSPANIDLILRHDPAWKGVLAYDEFSYRIMKLKPPPFEGGRAGPWEETDATKAAIWIERRWWIAPKLSIVDEIARSVAWDARYHCVLSWLRSRPPWDGTDRLTTLMADAFGAEQSAYTAHVGTGLLVTAVARVRRPGCKVDTMVVLEGGQGIGKSTALIELFSPAWYVDIIEPPSHKDFYITLQGGWVVEIGEMQSFTRSEVNQVKQAITRRDDKFRAPYDKASSDHPRQSIFVGTTNADTYLMDPTGGRRFLPVRCTHANVQYVREMRDQLFAEAIVKFKAGFKWWAYPEDQAQVEQDRRYVEDSWVEPIENWLNGHVAPTMYPDGLPLGFDLVSKQQRPDSATTTQVMRYALSIELARHTRQDQMRVGAIMRRLGWVQERLQRVPGDPHTRIRPWSRPPQAVSESPSGAEGVPM